jgi:gentisate 1,2-dioxygenase
MSTPHAQVLPPEYERTLATRHLKPAWTALGDLVPRVGPIRHSQAVQWRYAEVRESLLQAGELVPMELAERRVLAMVNPGLAPRLATTPSMFLGMQLILGGEQAPPHRHTPGAARLVMEGSGAYTAVNGERLMMEPGDLILTPPQHWHEHHNPGRSPMIWMDVLDHPVAIPLETSYSVEQSASDSESIGSGSADASTTLYTCPGFVPYRRPTEAPRRYPLMRFPWTRARAALLDMARALRTDKPVHLMYVNPETGASPLETLAFSVRMLRPGEEVTEPPRSPSAVFVVLEGSGEASIDEQQFSWKRGDALVAPTFSRLRLRNASSSAPAFVLQADDAPLQHKLGFYEDELVRTRFGRS